MGLIGNLMGSLKDSLQGKRTWTPNEVRDLITAGDLTLARTAAKCLIPALVQREAEVACLLGEISFHERKDADAAASFREALSKAPGMPEAHYGLSLLLAENGEFDTAAQHAQFALAVQGREPRFLAQLGYCHVALKNYQLAEARLRDALRLDPNYAPAWNNLGIVLLSKALRDEARSAFQRAVSLRPGFALAQHNLAALDAEREDGPAVVTSEPTAANPQDQDSEGGALLAQIRKVCDSDGLDAAIDVCESLAMSNPDDAALVVELQGLYDRAGDPQSGIDALEAFVANHPDNHAATAALGLAYSRTTSLAASEQWLKQALHHEPDSVDLLCALAQTHSSQGRYAEGMPLVERALALAPSSVAIRTQLASALTNSCRYEEALVACESLRAEGKEPACFGSVLSYLGRFDEALEWLDRALDVQPNDPNLRFQRAQIELLFHRFETGWDNYAYRGLSYSKNFRMLPFALWQGEPLQGKQIVVLAEQGLGDQVMFASCLTDLLALGPSEVVVEVIGRIAPTIERSFPECRVIATRQDSQMEWAKDVPKADYFVPLGDLPKFFRRSLGAFPATKGYLRPASERVAFWREKFAELGPGPYIGLSWRGGTEVTRTGLRSFQASMLAPFTRATNAQFVSLQYGEVERDLAEARAAGLPMAHWPESISNLDEFSAIIGALDLVVTVCNTTVHYAGAVGRPVWVMSPKIPEWRYGMSGDTLPWYPSSRILRQEVPGEWAPIIRQICNDLSGWKPEVSDPKSQES